MDAGTMVLTGATLGGLAILPIVGDVLKQYVTLLIGAALFLGLLYLMAPYSPEINLVWASIENTPGTVFTAFSQSDNVMVKLVSEFKNAFH